MTWTSTDGAMWPDRISGSLRRLVLVGPPGAGKSSQGMRLAPRCRVAHVSTGELLRDEVRRASPLGQRARDDIAAGHLVPDSLILHLIEHQLAKTLEDGFVLDGYPRTIDQAEQFMRSLGRVRLDRVVELAIPDEVAVQRLTARAVCRQCGHMADAPMSRCNRCGGEMTRRSDDDERVVRARLATCRSQTSVMLDFFRDAGLLTTVDGNRPPNIVHADLVHLATNAHGRATRGSRINTHRARSS